MDVQATPSPYDSLGAAQPAAGNPPALGQQVPGHTGGLPAQAGLSVLANPMAEELRSKGRGEDTMLVHMTPAEVNSLQGLAMATGGSLTINPHTGLPEAGWLGKLLPTLLGGLGMAVGIPPVWMGALGAVGGTIATGDLGKGLMAGLQAYGGASAAGGLGLAGKINPNAFGLMGSAGSGMTQAAAAPIAQAAEKAAGSTSGELAGIGKEVGNLSFPETGLGGLGGGSAMGMGMDVPVQNMASSAINAAGKTGLAGFAQGFGDAAKMGLPGGIVAKAAPMLAARGLMSGISGAVSKPSTGYTNSEGQIDNSYQGPYTAQQRTATFAPTTEELIKSTKERDYFPVDIPEVYNMQGQVVQPGSHTAPGTPIVQSVLNPKTKKGEPLYSFVTNPYMTSPEEQRLAAMYPSIYGRGVGYAEGGEVELADGAFVVDARTVSELGNGSSGAGQELLAKMGGRPIRGPGDGVSDSVPARIGRDQPARVARDEVVFAPEAVRRIGKGDEKRGAQKLYAMMDKAHAARKRAARGSDTKLRKGLA